MSYFSLGAIDKSRFMVESVAVKEQQEQQPTAITTEVAAARAEEEAFLASLSRCIPGEPEASSQKIAFTAPNLLGWVYTNRHGLRTCSMNPIGDRARELRAALKIVPVLMAENQVSWKDGKWIPIRFRSPAQINPRYVELLLRAQNNPPFQTVASAARISWELRNKDGSEIFNPTPGRPLTAAEFDEAFRSMMELFGKGGSRYKMVEAAAKSNTGEQALRFILANVANSHAGIAGVRERTSNEDVFFCTQTMGLTGAAADCCLQYVADVKVPGSSHAPRYESYQKKVSEQDPSVMQCIFSAEQARINEEAAKGKRTLILAAGAVGAVVIGAVLLKGRKR
jgi:hypothetical protein